MIALFQIQIQRNQSIMIDKAFDHKMCKMHHEAYENYVEIKEEDKGDIL